MNGTNTKIKSNWIVPKEIIGALGKFDTDPYAVINSTIRTARVMYDISEDGINKEWEGRVWLNPPHKKSLAKKLILKMASHNNGIALLHSACDTQLFQDVIFKKATAIKFIKGRVKFLREDGTRAGVSNYGSVLVAFGGRNAKILKDSNIEGYFMLL